MRGPVEACPNRFVKACRKRAVEEMSHSDKRKETTRPWRLKSKTENETRI
jgi:hypothetical protein